MQPGPVYEAQIRKRVTSGFPRRPGALVAAGLSVVFWASWAASKTISDLGQVTVPVRAAQPAEAVDPDAAARTVVGIPGSAPSALPKIRAKLLTLLALAALASFGAGVAAWNVSVICQRRRDLRREQHNGDG